VIPGLVSVTFRHLTPAEVVALAVEAGLAAVEWAADAHVPVGELGNARQVASLCADNGIGIEAYGSYYRADGDFEPVLATALALGATRIRVWAGRSGADWYDTVDDLRRVSALAGAEGVEIAVEHHAGTLTGTLASALDLYYDVPSLRPYWQPPIGCSDEEALAELDALSPVTAHVFSWAADGTRLPLAARESLWRPALARLAALPGDRHALLEFVRDDSPAAFLRDAATLRDWLAAPG
jgi:hypothetical protein